MPAAPPRIDFYSANDGRRLAVRVWDAAKPASARVVFLHGVTSHGGWYSQCAEYLAAAGLDVHFLDRRGSGLNGEQAGDVDCWRTWADDIAAYVNTSRGADAVSDNAHRRPTILCGISWGGKLAAAVARRHPTLCDGVAFICPGLYSPFMPRIIRRIALAVPPPAWLQQRRLRIPLRRAELFTDTPSWRDFVAQDPLALRSVTWRFAQADRRLTRYARQAATFLRIPTLLVLAGRDRIVDNRSTRDFFGRIASPRKTLLEYAAAGHTLEFEPDPTPYFADLAEWLQRTALAAASR